MLKNVQLSWLIPLVLPSGGREYIQGSQSFNLQNSKSFLGKIGGISNLDLLPVRLNPTHVFYNAINSKKNDLGFNGKRLPFTYINSNSGTTEKLACDMYFFNDSVVILKVAMGSLDVANDYDLLELLRIESHSEIYKLVKAICGLVVSGPLRSTEFNETPKAYPICMIGGESSTTDTFLVELLTRHRGASNDIVHRVVEKNKQHQLSRSQFLIDRQGIVVKQNDNDDIDKKLTTSTYLFQLAIVLAVSFHKRLLSNVSESECQAIKGLVDSSDLIFSNSVTAQKTWELLSAEFRLKELFNREKAARAVVSNNEAKDNRSDKKSFFFTHIYNPLLVPVLVVAILSIGGAISQKFGFLEFLSVDPVVLLSPQDGLNDLKRLDKELKWSEIDGADTYVVNIELYVDGKWQDAPKVPRIVTKDTEASAPIDYYGRFRWKVLARDRKSETIAESIYWEFVNSK